MRRSYPYLKNKEFLKLIDNLKIKSELVRMTLLNWNEEPLQEIQGKVLGGNININGDSSMRRTGSLSLYVEDTEFDYNRLNQIVSINKKVCIEVGIKNTTDKFMDYPIIWFPLGTYIIMEPSFSHQSQGTTVSLQLKDKMCLLNGDCGGMLPAAVTFHEMDTLNEETGEIELVKPTIYQIIQEVVNHFGGEQLGKIIISDVDTRIKQVLRWSGSSPLYIKKYIDKDNLPVYTASLSLETFGGDTSSVFIYDNSMDVGYRYTDFTYPGELIGNAGDSVCTILDKIRDTLGNYEYFYDVEGNFVFQEKKNYLNTTYATSELLNMQSTDYLVDMTRGKQMYDFTDSNLILSYTNNPKFSMIKNDFIVWGIKKSVTEGTETPIRYHLAIDKKPKVGNKYNVAFETTEDGTRKAFVPTRTHIAKNNTVEVTTTDWRSELYLSGVVADANGTAANYYYTELDNEWLKLYDLENTTNPSFKDEVIKYPSNLDYFLDFIDARGGLSEFSIENIGRRSKIISDNSINCLFEPEIPDLIFIETNTKETTDLVQECKLKGQNYTQIDSYIYKNLVVGGTFNSALNLIKDLLYEYTNYNESVSIQSLPIYYLEPNVLIKLNDSSIGISGDYLVQSISLPLDINGAMSISAVRALDKI